MVNIMTDDEFQNFKAEVMTEYRNTFKSKTPSLFKRIRHWWMVDSMLAPLIVYALFMGLLGVIVLGPLFYLEQIENESIRQETTKQYEICVNAGKIYISGSCIPNEWK